MKFRPLIVILVLLNLLFAGFSVWKQPKSETIFVLTPMVDVWPSAAPITQAEKEKLEELYSFQPESRGLGQVYSHMGATLSFHDLLRGIHFLEKSETPLSEAQKKQLLGKLKIMQEDHKRLLQLQKELIKKEDGLADIIKKMEQP